MQYFKIHNSKRSALKDKKTLHQTASVILRNK